MGSYSNTCTLQKIVESKRYSWKVKHNQANYKFPKDWFKTLNIDISKQTTVYDGLISRCTGGQHHVKILQSGGFKNRN